MLIKEDNKLSRGKIFIDKNEPLFTPPTRNPRNKIHIKKSEKFF